jgi:hypothetical protein
MALHFQPRAEVAPVGDDLLTGACIDIAPRWVVDVELRLHHLLVDVVSHMGLRKMIQQVGFLGIGYRRVEWGVQYAEEDGVCGGGRRRGRIHVTYQTEREVMVLRSIVNDVE